jgi:hypothetical protein
VLSLPEPFEIRGYLLPVAVKVLGISYRTLARRIDSGEIKTIPGPRCTLIPPDELQRLVAKGLRKRAVRAGGRPKSAKQNPLGQDTPQRAKITTTTMPTEGLTRSNRRKAHHHERE